MSDDVYLGSYNDATPGEPGTADVVAAALQYRGTTWSADNCTGLIWAISVAVGAPYYQSVSSVTDGLYTAPSQLPQGYVVPDPNEDSSVFVLPHGSGGSLDWTTTVSSDWQNDVKIGDLVRIPGTGFPAGTVGRADKGHSFVVVGGSVGDWEVIDNTSSSELQGGSPTTPITISEHTFDDTDNTFYNEILSVQTAYISSLSTSVSISTPTLSPITPITVDVGSTGTITTADLDASEPGFSPIQLNYVVISGPSEGTLLVNGAVSGFFTQADIDSGLVTYRESGANVTTDQFSFQLTDTEGGSLDSSYTIDVQAPSPPSFSGAGTVAGYASGGGAVTIDPGLTVTDAGAADLASATVAIALGFYSGDVLGFASQNGIVGTYDSATGTLILSGTASLPAYTAALDSVTFASTASDATAGGSKPSRAIEWQATGSNGGTAEAISTIDVGAPSVQGPQFVGAGNTVDYVPGGLDVLPAGTLRVTDNGATQLASATIAIAAGFQAGQDTLGPASDEPGISASYDTATGMLTLSGLADLAAYTAALDGATFASSDSSGGQPDRTIAWSVTDANAQSVTATSTIDVQAPASQAVTLDDATMWNDGDIPIISTDVNGGPTLYYCGSITAQGYSLTNSSRSDFAFDSQTSAWASAFGDFYDGPDILFIPYSNSGVSTIDLAKSAGGAFALRSVALDSLVTAPGITATFVGTEAGGGTVSQTFDLDSSPGFQTFDLGGAFADVSGVAFTASTDVQFDDISLAPACFATDTRIETTGGSRAVQDLAVGDTVLTVRGIPARIVWLGRRHVECRRHRRPDTVWPIRVEQSAFGAGRPRRDLFLSPDHAVFIDGVLIPVRLLADGASIAQVRRDRITYWHIELAMHDVVFAEGLPCESFFDAGSRAAFDNAGGVTQLHPDFAPRRWDADAYAPLVLAGRKLDRTRARLARFAAIRRASG